MSSVFCRTTPEVGRRNSGCRCCSPATVQRCGDWAGLTEWVEAQNICPRETAIAAQMTPDCCRKMALIVGG